MEHRQHDIHEWPFDWSSLIKGGYMIYIGKKPGDNLAITVGKDDIFDKLLGEGYHIYGVDDDGTQTEIATPEEGFLVERPVLHHTERSGEDLVRAIRIIMGTDEGDVAPAGLKKMSLKRAELTSTEETNIDLISEAYAFRQKLNQLLGEGEK